VLYFIYIVTHININILLIIVLNVNCYIFIIIEVMVQLTSGFKFHSSNFLGSRHFCGLTQYFLLKSHWHQRFRSPILQCVLLFGTAFLIFISLRWLLKRTKIQAERLLKIYSGSISLHTAKNATQNRSAKSLVKINLHSTG
jgi:hypothetical protein